MLRIYVGNLPYQATEEDVKKYFASAGEVTEVTIPRNDRGQSKGFGFVSFAERAGVDAALAMDGQQMDGRPLRINEARPREERQGGDSAPQAEAAPVADTSDTEEADEAPKAESDSKDEGDGDKAE